MTDEHRTPLILISGLADEATRHVTDALHERGTAVVEYDVRHVAGLLHRRLRHGRDDRRTTLGLARACVCCAIREDLLPLLCSLAGRPGVRRIVVRLAEALDPERVCWEIRHALVGERPVVEDVVIEAVVAALDAGTWLTDALGDDTLDDRGYCAAPDDERTVAQLALAGVELADVLVLAGHPPDAWTAARTCAVLERVAPSTPVVDLSSVDTSTLLAAVRPDARRGEPDDPHGPLLHGEPPLDADCGVALLAFCAQRPFHPERLHEAIDVLLDGVARTRGRAWVASQPDVALWIESAGGALGVAHAGPWLDVPHGPAWEDVSPERRTLASLRWHPVWGDRAQELVIVTHRSDPAEIDRALRDALLTDAELAQGRDAWSRFPDPFGAWHEEPADGACEDAGTGRRGGEW